MDNRDEVREFLTSRRAKVDPAQLGLSGSGGHRRVPGLRRGEVAAAAGVSIEYYTRLERGNLRGASEAVLEAIARALQMDEAERAHLFDLARAAGPAPRTRRRSAPAQLRPGLQHLLDAMTAAPAFVRNGRLDVLAVNALGRALYAPAFPGRPEPVNLARFCFLDEQAIDFYPDWDDAADTSVALLRTEAGRDPYDRGLTELVGELSTRSEEFRVRWAAHDVRLHRTGTKHFNHPVVGRLDLSFEALPIATEANLTLTAYTAAPASPSADSLALLASWAATQDRTSTDAPTS
jgi:transcriptional regulator with XRE-family HTH domain